MKKFRHEIRIAVSRMLARRQVDWRSAGGAVDWLPPVMGPGDWSTGVMIDHSASWYMDRIQR
ncbi:MAG: hypothetical protein R3D05_12240 [Dongiaceae bacterium]